MKLDVHSLQRLLGDRLCAEVGVERRPDDTLMLRTHFRFPDGDGYPIYLSATPSGAVRLSDRGHTLMHISYEHDVDSFMEGSRGLLLERIMDESGLQWDGGAFCIDTSPEQLPQAMFTFGQALTKVYDLTLLSRSNVTSTFYEDLANLLSHFHRHELKFESLLVFADQASIPRLDLARLSDVGGDMISSLGSSESFSRKLLQRVA